MHSSAQRRWHMRNPHQVLLQPVAPAWTTELAEPAATQQRSCASSHARDAYQIEIRHAIEETFGVRVTRVRTANYPGKWRRVGMNIGRRPGYKKAIVKLAPGEMIDVYEGF